VIFGEVVDGFSVVEAIENTETLRGDRPKNEVVIAECGILTQEDQAIAGWEAISAEPEKTDEDAAQAAGGEAP